MRIVVSIITPVVLWGCNPVSPEQHRAPPPVRVQPAVPRQDQSVLRPITAAASPDCTTEATPPNASVTVTIENTFPSRQWIHLDDRHLLGTVARGARCGFRVPRGSHRLRATDSADRNDNPVERRVSIREGTAWVVSQQMVHH